MLNEITLFIIGHCSLGWTIGEDIFAGYLPLRTASNLPVPKRVVVILERTPGAVVGDLPDYADKFIQIWNRAETYQEAKTDAEELYACLHGSSGWALPVFVSGVALYACVIDALGTPAPIANPNDKGLFEFSTNYVFRIENP
jgi:hypothetical protein